MATPTSFFEVRLPPVVGTGDTNYILNPSAEDGTTTTPTNYFGFGTATITRVTTYARQVAPDSSYSYRVQTGAINSGFSLVCEALPSGNIYVSFWIRGTYTAANLRVAINVEERTPTLYETDGAWSWYVIESPITGVSGQTGVLIYQTTSGMDAYIDDVVCQAGALTTSFHGGYAGVRSNGIRHQSTSTLVPFTEAGEPNLAAGTIYGFDHTTTSVMSHYISKASGLGLPSIDNLTQETILAGKQYVSSKLGARNIVFISALITTSISNQHSQRASLIDYLPPGQKFVLRYRGHPTYNGGTNDVLEITCVYQTGLEGMLELPSFENLSITVTAHNPLFFPTGETATSLTMAQSQTVGYSMRRSRGEWSVAGGSSGSAVFTYALAAGAKGHVFAGGDSGSENLRGFTGSAWADCGVMVGGDKEINAIAFDPSGKFAYVAGTFTTTIGGVANTVNIARYELPATGVSGGTWTALSTGTNGRVRALVVVPTSSGHDVYAFGDFTSPYNYVAKWNGSAWSSLGPNSASSVTGIHDAVYDNNDIIYFGGAWTGSIGTVSAPGGLAVVNGTGSLSSGNWRYKIAARTGVGTTLCSSAVGSGTSATGKDVSWSSVTGATSYDLYREFVPAGGIYYFLVNTTSTSYSDTGAVTLSEQAEPSAATDGARSTNVGKYEISTNSFQKVGTSGFNSTCKALALADDFTTLYGGGAFTAADGIKVGRVAQFNGVAWSAMSDNSNIGVSGGDVESMLALPTGEIAVGGAFTSAGSSLVGTLGANLAFWQPGIGGAGVWTHSDLAFPASTTVYSMMLDLNGDFWIGTNTSSSATTSVATSVTAAGMAGAFRSYPRLYVVGPGVFKYVENERTGDRIWFNLPVGTNEVVTLDFRNKTVTTSQKNASRAAKFVAGDLGEFGLLNGINKLVVLYTGTSGDATLRLSDPATRLSADS
jgi:hypothetical protein